MKTATNFTRILLFTLIVTLSYSCSNDDNETIINLHDVEVTIDENPSAGAVVGTVQSDTNISLVFSITSQTPNGALEINENTGVLSVADASVFDYETNPTITAIIAADKAQNNARVTITLNNINELSSQDYTTTVDENPTNGQSLGTVQASSEGVVNFGITSQTPEGALNIDTSTGELTVADATLFDYETNPTITATISVTSSGNMQSLTATITLNNISELSVQDYTTTIDENPTNGQSLGTVQASSEGVVNFGITSQTPEGALNIDTSTGELTVADATLFDYETNPTITATISVTSSGNMQSLTATINLNNISELSAQNYTTTIDENPTNGQSLGSIQANGEGTLSYSISSQTPSNAVSIDATTGELTVADATLFDYETNPTITATISITNSVNTQTVTATINLSDLNEIGEFKFGGIIFWINASGDEGLVLALTNQATNNSSWGCAGTITGATGTAIGTGQTNTTMIVSNGCDISGSAAELAHNLSLEGYNDWFLPSANALIEVYNNSTSISSALSANGGDSLSPSYWSSTEIDDYNAGLINLNGETLPVTKSTPYFATRAVRAWTD